jgi:hypothetical protein
VGLSFLPQQIKEYAAQHTDSFTLCADPLIVPGGRKSKE